MEKINRLMPRQLDANMSQLVEANLKELGILYALGSAVEEIVGETTVSGVVVNGENIPAGIVVFSVGAKPNLALVPDDIEKDVGIVVDEQMRTSDPNVYAIGDCTVSKNYITGERFMPYLAVPAARQGMVAALGILGMKGRYRGALGTFVSTLGDMEIAAVGLRENEAKERYDIVASKAKHLHKPDWLHGEALTLKLIINRDNLQILGAQAIGRGAKGVIDRIAMVIRLDGNLVDLIGAEHGYCPHVSQLYDIVNMAADIALRRLKGADISFDL